MFNNVGQKIKILALIVFWFGVVAFAIMGILFGYGMFQIEEFGKGFFGAVLIIGVGVLSSYLAVLLLYAFGDLVENTYIIAHNSAVGLQYDKREPETGNKICSNCEHVNPPSAVVCQTCGKRL